MIMPVEKRKTLAEISHKVPSGENSKKMKSLIQSLRYKNSPKDRKLIQTKKAMSEGYQKLGLWNEWKDNLNEAYDLEEGELDEYKKANSLCELAKIESCRGEVECNRLVMQLPLSTRRLPRRCSGGWATQRTSREMSTKLSTSLRRPSSAPNITKIRMIWTMPRTCRGWHWPTPRKATMR